MSDSEYILFVSGGTSGVFDIDDLVKLLEFEKGIDICTIEVPKERQYVDYLVIVSGLSTRHLLGMAESLRKMVSSSFSMVVVFLTPCNIFSFYLIWGNN